MAGVQFSFLLHSATFIASLAVILGDYTYMDLPNHHTYAGRFKFLTFWNFLCGLLYNNMAALLDALAWLTGKESKFWRVIRDFLFASIVFPVAASVGVMALVLHMTNPYLMRSPEEEKIITWWMDHGYHTLPVLAVFAQACLIHHDYANRRMALIALATFDALYTAWLFWIAHRANLWVYPFLGKLSFSGVVAFITAGAVLNFGLYFVGMAISGVVWGKLEKIS